MTYKEYQKLVTKDTFVAIKKAQFAFKQSLKNIDLHRKERAILLRQIIDSNTPKWGGIKITIINYSKL
jgi:hypothetical protein